MQSENSAICCGIIFIKVYMNPHHKPKSRVQPDEEYIVVSLKKNLAKVSLTTKHD